jgi:hypothetical protein
MPWLKKAAEAPTREKIWELSDPLYRLYDGGLHYCARELTDGHIPASRISPLTPKPATKQQIEALVTRRLWHRLPGLTCKSCIKLRAEHGAVDLPRSGYLVHDFLEFNPSKREWDRRQEVRRSAGKMGADARWGDGSSDSTSHSSPDSSSHSSSHDPLSTGANGSSHSKPDGISPSSEHGPYPVLRTPSSGAIAPVVPEDPFAPEEPKDADRSRDQVRAGRRKGPGLRHAGEVAEELLRGRRPRAAS